jgi:hypothetical protein
MKPNTISHSSRARPAPSTTYDHINAEVTKQLREMKQQLNKEIVEDLQAMRSGIREDITRQITDMIQREVSAQMQQATAPGGVIDKKINKHSDAIIEVNNRQLVAARESTKELVQHIGQGICNTVYGQVIGELNEKIIPKVNNMVQWVNFKLEDGHEVVDLYRRAVEYQANSADLRLITDGKKDERIISEHVRTFFGEDD